MVNLKVSDLDSLTLENFREVTGKRFRMTREQKALVDKGTLTREQAFQDFVSTLRADLGKTQALTETPAEKQTQEVPF